MNWNKLLAYKTVQIAEIRDWKLGLLHYTFMLAIVLYIVVWAVIFDKGFEVSDFPTGTVRFSLRHGSEPIDTTRLRYCTENEEEYPFEKEPCAIWDGFQALFPEEQESAMLVATRVSIREETRTCEPLATACEEPIWNIDSAQTIYVAAVEDFTIMVSHTVRAPVFLREAELSESDVTPYQAVSNRVHGVLETKTGAILREFPADENDILSVRELCEAAGLRLDDESTALGAENEPWRYSGPILIMRIRYFSGKNGIEYAYQVEQVPNAEYKIEEYQWETYTETERARRIFNRHGVQIFFLQEGLITKFDFQQLLITFVSGMGLLAVATLIVDFLSVYVMPDRHLYADAKFTPVHKDTDMDIASAPTEKGYASVL